MNEILKYYGFETIEQAMKAHGYSRASEEWFLKELYEEDTTGTDKYQTMQEMLYN